MLQNSKVLTDRSGHPGTGGGALEQNHNSSDGEWQRERQNNDTRRGITEFEANIRKEVVQLPRIPQ